MSFPPPLAVRNGLVNAIGHAFAELLDDLRASGGPPRCQTSFENRRREDLCEPDGLIVVCEGDGPPERR